MSSFANGAIKDEITVFILPSLLRRQGKLRHVGLFFLSREAGIGL